MRPAVPFDPEVVGGGDVVRNVDEGDCLVGGDGTSRRESQRANIRFIAEDEGLTWPTPVEIKFEGKGDRCTVMVAIERLQTRAEADGYRRAWGEALDRLKAFIEGR